MYLGTSKKLYIQIQKPSYVTPETIILPFFYAAYLIFFLLALIGIFGLISKKISLSQLLVKRNIAIYIGLGIIIFLMIHAYELFCIDIICMALEGQPLSPRCGFTCAGLTESQTMIFYPTYSLIRSMAIPISILLSLFGSAGLLTLKAKSNKSQSPQ